jgi:DNA-directed RNA polymerase specialized sigma24 family protein
MGLGVASGHDSSFSLISLMVGALEVWTDATRRAEPEPAAWNLSTLIMVHRGDCGQSSRCRIQPARGRVGLEAAAVVTEETSEDLEALDEALNKMAAEDTLKAEVVKLRFFAGLTMPEIASVLKISLATAERHWTYARTWLFAELKDVGNSEKP